VPVAWLSVSLRRRVMPDPIARECRGNLVGSVLTRPPSLKTVEQLENWGVKLARETLVSQSNLRRLDTPDKRET